MKNTSGLILGLLALAGIAFFFLRRKEDNKAFGNTNTATQPLIFGLGGKQTPLVTLPSIGGDAAWASVAGAGINAFGRYASSIFAPNNGLPNTNKTTKFDAPSTNPPSQVDSWTLSSADLDALEERGANPDFSDSEDFGSWEPTDAGGS